MPLSFQWSAQVSDVFVLRRPLLSFFRFKGLAHVVENVTRLLVVAILDVTLVLVVVVVVNVTLVLAAVVVTIVHVAGVVVAVVIVILLANGDVLFPQAPTLTPTAALAVFVLFPS